MALRCPSAGVLVLVVLLASTGNAATADRLLLAQAQAYAPSTTSYPNIWDAVNKCVFHGNGQRSCCCRHTRLALQPPTSRCPLVVQSRSYACVPHHDQRRATSVLTDYLLRVDGLTPCVTWCSPCLQ
jgi:hypothetical protein